MNNFVVYRDPTLPAVEGTPQQRCFALFCRALHAVPLGYCEPFALFQEVVDEIRRQSITGVRLRHGAVIHTSVHVTLACEEAEVEIEFDCLSAQAYVDAEQLARGLWGRN